MRACLSILRSAIPVSRLAWMPSVTKDLFLFRLDAHLPFLSETMYISSPARHGESTAWQNRQR